MPPTFKKITINKETNDILDAHFGGKISLIKGSKLTKLYDEGLITKRMKKFLQAIRVAYNKSEKGDYTLRITYDLKEEPKKVDEEPKKDEEPEEDEEPEKDEEPKKDEEPEKDEEPKIELTIERNDDVQSESEFSPDSPRVTQEGVIQPYDTPGAYLDIKESNYVVPHRKAFVDFINKGFYKRILRENANEPRGPGMFTLDVYQTLVKEYLAIDTPYRGLLVYHGLGTGKTATAVSMAESVSSEMDIITMLPASLENNFIGEVKRWGKDELDIHGGRWTFTPISEIEDSGKLRKQLLDRYTVTVDTINESFNHMVREVKKKISFTLIEKDFDIQHRKGDLRKQVNERYKKISDTVKAVKGFWNLVPSGSGTTYEELEPYEKISLECQVHRLIQLKYNFIHYNPLPTIKPEDQEVGSESDEEDELFKEELGHKRGNEAIKLGLLKDMKSNINNHDVHSPFYNKTIIIDEVHNFVREILNDSGSARIFYEWILDAENVKLVFLSGTPIINKPCEVAVLYNMLKGRIKSYNLTIKSAEDPVALTKRFNDLFYKDDSPVELFHISRKEGKLVISFTKHQETFVSVMNPKNEVIYTSAEHKYSYKQFINEIYKAVEDVFDKDDILPARKDALEHESDEYKVFDEIVNIPFLRKQTLFEVNHQDEMIDLTENERFMDYFFSDSYEIDAKKKTLLRRMLMGLTSYYPIDRSKIGSMPTITEPKVTAQYEHYMISKNITVEACPMSSTQFSKYTEAWRSEKKKDLIRQMRRHLHDDIPFDFNIRTRQNCNIVYKDDEFRYIRDSDRAYIEKMKQYDEMKQSHLLEYGSQLSEVSPKIYKMMTNIQQFMNNKVPTGKVLIYSDFRGDSGAEALEETLAINGYSLYDPKNPSTKSLKYTFITGQESSEQRRLNQDAYNHEDNKFGEQIQVMIISGAGAEGISLTCVRQVHIFEPYWNFVRIDQVFGRAIRLKSHDSLEMKDRNVAEYLYLSVLPTGNTIEEVYTAIKHWPAIPDLKDIKSSLAEAANKDAKDTIDMIMNIGQTIDQKIFDMMERKYKVSQNIISIIKESSLDCIQHTRDDPQLNDRCIRFSHKLLHEIAYFPGISASELFEIDHTQLKASFLKHVKPNHYIVSGSSSTALDDYIYYEVEGEKEDIDIRYLRENAKKICTVSSEHSGIYFEVEKDHPLNKELGKQFSVYQDIVSLRTFMDDIYPWANEEPSFPTVEKILQAGTQGYKIKFNTNELMFYSPHKEDTLRRLYKFDEYVQNQLSKPLVICDEEVYIQD